LYNVREEVCIKREIKIRVNEEIRANQVRLVDVEGKHRGIFTKEEALKIAREKKMDLVEVAPEANPPVCRIMDYEKFRYEQEKQKKKSKKKQTGNVLKEIRLRYTIGEHDFKVKVRNICKFLEEGYHVKVSLEFRGREMIYRNRGRKILERVIEEVQEIGKVEVPPRMNGRNMELYLVSRRNKAR